jgi:hypothetical protein
MHTLHYWLVEAEDKQDAFSIVQNTLINDEGIPFVEWSDWHVVGGGRWSNSQYEDSSDMICSYTEKPALFDSIIEDIKKARVKEMQDVMSKIDTDKFISNMVDYISNNASIGDRRFDMNEYYIRSACELMSERYTSSSYFYDLIGYTANMAYIKEHLDTKNPAMLFLVPIDFHF